MSSVSDVAEGQTGWPLADEFPGEARSTRVDLPGVVARLQKEVENFRAVSGYGGSRKLVVLILIRRLVINQSIPPFPLK